jgi:hypothetical protein
MIYIATNEHGRGLRHVTAFDNRDALHSYALEVMAWHADNHLLSGRPSIGTICDALCDAGVGFGSRSHHRVSRKEAALLVRSGVSSHGCWGLA